MSKATNTPATVTIAELAQQFRSLGHALQNTGLTCVSIVRNENYFIRAFLAHYRELGVVQFVFWDDGSTDGTREYLLEQPDCVVLECSYAYGDIVKVVDAPFEPKSGRAGVLFRSLIASILGIQGWTLFADVDEFLFVPSEMGALPQLLARLDPTETSIRSALVEFYPPTLWSGTATDGPSDFAGLLDRFGHFDARPVLAFSSSGSPELIADTASMRMFRRMGIGQGWRGFWPPARLLKWLQREPGRTPIVKTPLVRWSPSMYLNGNHPGVGQSTRDLVLASAHFKFTPDLDRRTELALQTRAYAGKSVAYSSYDALLRKMRLKNQLSFLGPDSRKFESVDNLIAAGIMTIGERFRAG